MIKDVQILKVNDYGLDYVSSYSPIWTSEAVFNNWDGTMSGGIGKRFSASVQTGSMTEDAANELITELSKIIVDFYSCKNSEVEYAGKAKINNYCKNPLVETPTTRFCTVSFELTAVTLTDSVFMRLIYGDVNILQHFDNVSIYSVEHKCSKQVRNGDSCSYVNNKM